MGEYRFTPEEAQGFRIPQDAQIPPSAWEQEYWDTVRDMEEERLTNIFTRSSSEQQYASQDEVKKKCNTESTTE